MFNLTVSIETLVYKRNVVFDNFKLCTLEFGGDCWILWAEPINLIISIKLYGPYVCSNLFCTVWKFNQEMAWRGVARQAGSERADRRADEAFNLVTHAFMVLIERSFLVTPVIPAFIVLIERSFW